MLIQIDDFSQIDFSTKCVVVEEDERYPYQLSVLAEDQESFNDEYSQFVSRFGIMRETGSWQQMVNRLTEDGWMIYNLPSARKVIDSFEHYSSGIVIPGLTLPKVGDRSPGLFPYQEYGLKRAVEAAERFFFYNWGTGTGKGTIACGGSQALFNSDQIDVVLVFTYSKMKINLTREFNQKTTHVARNIEGAKPKRAAEFEKADADIYVLNYEKARSSIDFEVLAKRIKGKRVLFLLDEVQKVLTYTNNHPNQAADGLRKLIRTVKDPYVWALSATVVGRDPERFWRLFDLPKGQNPLGKLSDFRADYSDGEEFKYSVWGADRIVKWNLNKLSEIPHRIAPWTHAVRKSDPGVREFFKEVEFEVIPVQLSDEDRKLYDLVEEFGKSDDKSKWGQYYRCLRYICNTPESLLHSKSEIAQEIVSTGISLTSKTSAKMEQLVELLTSIRDQGDKAVVFTEYTNLSLFMIADRLRDSGIAHVVHYGTGMTASEAQKAQDDFKADPSITVFLSSDAGSHGLSFQEARYVINYEPSYSYDIMTQRNARTDRADSYLDGLTNYVFVTEDTVEERIWKKNNYRRRTAAAIQGTVEEYERVSEDDDLEYLMLGSRAV